MRRVGGRFRSWMALRRNRINYKRLGDEVSKSANMCWSVLLTHRKDNDPQSAGS